METNPSLAERFWSKVDKRSADECWPWIGATDKFGRGLFGLVSRRKDRVTTRAPRAAWLLATGSEPPRHLSVCHSCDNPNCVNPAHLWLGTHQDNMSDASAKGRIGSAPHKVCPRGHSMTDEANIYLRPDGEGRNCRACIHIRTAQKKQRRLAK